jgi:ethanolamine utilization protein EutA
MENNKIEILSVGVDIGSSTSHVVFSNLLLIRDERSPTRCFEIKQRNVIYEGSIIKTPLLDDNTIDIDELTVFLREEYQHAGVDPKDIHTGAVIITGESARKHNAARIVETLSSDAGKFVAATAGPNFESLIAAQGSGAAARSKKFGKTILSCDIGGGTANMAISQNGDIVSTSCISVGGRLIGVDQKGIIRRLDPPSRLVLDHLGLDYHKGDYIPPRDIERIATIFADALFEAITGPAESELTQQLMVTNDLDFPDTIDEYAFSGGIAELMYGGENHCDDIGPQLAEQINRRLPSLPSPAIEPPNKIRATVIGAGAYSLSISGSSGYMDPTISFPICNVPVLRVDVDRARLSMKHVIAKVRTAFERFDFKEGDQIVALYFRDPAEPSYSRLELFAKAVEAALPRSIQHKIPIILVFEKDIACGVGNVMRRETGLQTNLLSLDELVLSEGDWIDIGEPLVDGQVFPVTVKSLAFHEK